MDADREERLRELIREANAASKDLNHAIREARRVVDAAADEAMRERMNAAIREATLDMRERHAKGLEAMAKDLAATHAMWIAKLQAELDKLPTAFQGQVDASITRAVTEVVNEKLQIRFGLGSSLGVFPEQR